MTFNNDSSVSDRPSLQLWPIQMPKNDRQIIFEKSVTGRLWQKKHQELSHPNDLDFDGWKPVTSLFSKRIFVISPTVGKL